MPPNISDRGKELYGKVKPILDAPPEEVHNALASTEFCVEVDGLKRRIDTRVVYVMSEYLQEAVQASPDTSPEAFKRLIGVKMFLNHEDNIVFASAPPVPPSLSAVRTHIHL
jgi:hypothetical protein